ILNTGTLTVSGSTVSGNSAGFGGGIMNTSSGLGATLTVTDSTVAGNSAQLVGGGIYNSPGCTLTVTHGDVSGTTAVDAAGVWTSGTLGVVIGSLGPGIAAGCEGGGTLSGEGTMMVSGSTISGNSADLGGGIFADGGALTVRDCVFTGNSATEGGGIYNNRPATLEVQGSTFSLHTASDSGGRIHNLGTATHTQCSRS